MATPRALDDRCRLVLLFVDDVEHRFRIEVLEKVKLALLFLDALLNPDLALIVLAFEFALLAKLL